MLSYLYAFLAQCQDEEGQGMAEYGLILALVAVALVAGFTALQGGIDGVLTGVTSSF